MATAVGTSFDISKLGKELDKLDKQLDAIVKKGDKAKHAIEQMLLGDNANNFLNKIEKIKKSVIDLSSVKDPMKWDSAKLKGYIDQVNRLIRTVNQINTVNGGSKQLIDTTNLGDAKKELSSLLKEVKSLEKAQSERSTSRNQTYSGALKYSSNVKNLEQERQAIINLEAARDKLKKTDGDYANKLNTLNEAIQRHERNLKDSAKTDQQRAAEAKKASDKIIEAQRREREEYEKRKKSTMDKWYSSNSERALKFSSNAKTLEDEARAIKYLESARAKLNTQDKNYERNLATLNSRIREHKKNLDDAKKGAQELQDKHNGLMNTGEQLKRALIGVFSVSAIKGYVSKLVEVRGEFELQHKALEVLVGDVAEANRLWEKTVQLAVKSPFAVKELVTYTKQLAAYRVESNKLYDTTKMLADISAGLGVDMNRLILAYGQVKAANYLRGTELRQFSEAGINVLQLLADRFTEIEGKAVSVGEVFDRVSKRMVSFADVQAVLESVTGAGGQFYKMQEQQAETLKFVWKNLRDSVDLMLNDIGAKNDSILKGTLSIVKSLVDNWEKVGNIIVPLFSMIIAKMAVMKTMTFIDDKAWSKSINKIKYFTTLLTEGKTAALRFSRTVEGIDPKTLGMNAMGAAISAVILLVGKLVMEWARHKADIKAINEEYSKLKEDASEITFGFNVAKMEDDIDAQKEKLSELISLANKEYSLNIKIRVKELTQEELEAQFQTISNQILEANAFSQEATKSAQGGWFGNIFTDNAKKDAEDYGEAFSNTASKVINQSHIIANALIELRDNGEKLTEAQENAIKVFTTPFDPKVKTETQYVNELIKAYQNLNVEANKYAAAAYWEGEGHQRESIFNSFGLSEGVTQSISLMLIDKHRFQKEVEDLFNSEPFTIEGKRTAVNVKAAIDRQGWSESAKEFAYELANEKWHLGITPIINTPDEKQLAEWAIRFKDAFPTAEEEFTWMSLTPNTDEGTFVSQLEAKSKDAKAIYESFNEGAERYTEAEANAAKAEDEVLSLMIKWFKGEKEEKEALQRLKKQISLIREAARAYDEMRKLHDEAYADKQIVKEYGPAFKEAKLGDISGYDFGTRQDEQNNLEKLRASAEKTKDGVLELNKAIAQVGVQVDNANQELADKRLFDAISDIFSNYEISLEMDKLNIPPDLAKRLFGLDSISLEELRPAILEKFNMSSMKGLSNVQIYESDAFQSMSEARQKELKESLEKEAKMTKDARIERLKTYSQYLAKEQHERIKFKMEEIRKIAEIDAMNEFNEDEKAVMKENIRRETNENMAKRYWEDFEKSPMFVNLFDDMELATKQSLNNMKTHLESMRDSMIAAGLPASDLKDILDKINQVEEELESRDPFNKLKSFGAVMFGTGGDSTVSREEFKEANANEAIYLKEAERLKENEESTLRLVAAKKEELNVEEAILAEFQKGTDEYRVQENDVNLIREEYSGLVKQHQNVVRETEENNKKLNKAQEITKQWKEQVKDVGDGFSFVQNAVNQVGDALSTTLQQTGLMSEDDAAIFDSAMNVANSALGLGASIASGDIVGIITNGLSLIGDIAATGDAAKQKAINSELEKAKQSEKIYNGLVDKYEKLQKAMEKSFTISQMNDNKKDMEENMDAQSDSIDEQIAALEEANAIEADKKKADQAAIDERNAQIEELRKQQEALKEQQEELDKQFVETLGGSYDYTGVAEQFLDAWLTAFEETGDGMKGLEDSFDDFWNSVLKKQVVYGGASEIMKEYMDKINKALSDGKLTDKEIAEIEAEEEETKKNLNDFYKWANEEYGLAEFGSEVDKLSGLQAGIQGITEEQADILASYWNAVRFSTASIDSKMDDSIAAIKNILKDTESEYENPIVANLKAIARNTDYIYALLSDVRGGDGVLSYMKVQLV